MLSFCARKSRKRRAIITIKARITAYSTAVGPASDDSKLNHQFGLRWADSGFPWASGHWLLPALLPPLDWGFSGVQDWGFRGVQDRRERKWHFAGVVTGLEP